MKKRYFVLIFSVFCCISLFGDNHTQEEVDFLLFSPNSGNRFENEEQAFIQLNKLAQYLSNKNPSPGQIIVCGYAAYAPNNIKSVDLSRERALTVMDELQKRGISKELFSDPVGYGAVSTWGDNADEDARKLNRRVRILLSGESPITITQEIIAAEIETPKANIPKVETPRASTGNTVKEKPSAPEGTPKFPWWILPLLALLLLMFLLFKKRSREQVHKKGITNAQPQIPITESKHRFASEEAVTTWMVNLDEEIRLRAYELSQQRGGSGDYREQDWYNAVHEISTWYTACGHSVFTDGGYWWAARSYSYDSPAAAVS